MVGFAVAAVVETATRTAPSTNFMALSFIGKNHCRTADRLRNQSAKSHSHIYIHAVMGRALTAALIDLSNRTGAAHGAIQY
jgi:hypothetical protein